MKTKIGLFIKNEEGQGMVEYGLIIILIAVAIIGSLEIFGTGIKNMYIDINNNFP